MSARLEKPVFIISFDCEGKWGFADNISSHQQNMLTNTRLEIVYRELIERLGQCGVRATFAFVAALTMSVKEYRASSELFNRSSKGTRHWLRQFDADVANEIYDGWLNPQLLEIVRSLKTHEIASHGFMHLPADGHLASHADFMTEMKCARTIWQAKQIRPTTFVYPRNLVCYQRALSEFGLIGYRENLFGTSGKLRRALSLASEFNTHQGAQSGKGKTGGVVRVPAGYFLNWRRGIRQRIPIAVTLKRWRHLINDAITHNKVVHLWSHPHNYIDGDSQQEVLTKVLEMVSVAMDKGDIVNWTVEEYCRKLLEGSSRLIVDTGQTA